MTNFEKLTPHIEALFGKGWTVEDFAYLYADAVSNYDCGAEDICIVARALGEDECTRRMGMTPASECKTDEDWDRWEEEKGNDKTCEDIIREWLMEEEL